eukprot:452141-Pyramimonas_sp.AAC.1
MEAEMQRSSPKPNNSTQNFTKQNNRDRIQAKDGITVRTQPGTQQNHANQAEHKQKHDKRAKTNANRRNVTQLHEFSVAIAKS